MLFKKKLKPCFRNFSDTPTIDFGRSTSIVQHLTKSSLFNTFTLNLLYYINIFTFIFNRKFRTLHTCNQLSDIPPQFSKVNDVKVNITAE